MIRSDNPFNLILQPSWGVYQFSTETAIDHVDKRWLSELSNRNGRIKTSHVGNGLTHYSVEIPHGAADAYGSLFLLKELIDGWTICSDLNASTGFREGDWNHLSFRHNVTSTQITPSDRTFTQRFTSSFMKKFPFLLSEKIGLAVAMDDLNDLRENDKWGNSLVILTLLGTALKQLAEIPKNDWKTSLADRALRTLEIVKKRSSSVGSVGSVLISSVGNLDHFHWAPNLNPAKLVMFPTPIYESSANVILWSKNGIQAIAVSCHKSHWLHSNHEKLLEIWRDGMK